MSLAERERFLILTGAGERRFQRIVPQAGRYPSTVLGFDLVLRQGSVRFILARRS